MSIDAHILTALRSAENVSVSGADLAQRLGVTRTAVWARIQELRALGYDISANPQDGYRLKSTPDVLHPDDLLSRLGQTKVIGRDIRVFQETTSTSDVAEKMGRDGVKEGVAVFAEFQSRGRGRLGRRWASPRAKGLWFSVLLRPRLAPMEITRLTVAAATALARAVGAATGLAPQIKWPNDVLIRGRKTAGILTEMTAELDRVRYVILGVGVDVNLCPSDFPADLRPLATSLRIEARRKVDRAELAVTILRELDRDYELACRDGFVRLAEEWEALCSTLGRQVTIKVGDRQVRGRAESLDEDGALLLRTEHGHVERIVGGDVTLVK